VFDPKQNPKMDFTAEFAMKNLPDFEKKKEKKK